MSWTELRKLGWNARMATPAFKSVIMFMIECSNPDGENVFPAVSTIERCTGLSEAMIRQAIADMEASGLLLVEADDVYLKHKKRRTVLRSINLELLKRLDIDNGDTTWAQVEVPVTNLDGSPKLGANGIQKTRKAWRTQFTSVGPMPSRVQPLDPMGPTIGPPYELDSTSKEKEPPLNSPHLSAGGTSDDKCSEETEGETSEFDGWARGWDNAARSAVDEIRGSATSAHVASEFVDRVRATRFPSRQVDGASFVRQLRSRLGKYGAETLQAVAVHCLERHSRALPDVAALVTAADAVERRKRIAAAPATPAGDGQAGQAFRAALERRRGPDWLRAWGAHLTIAPGEGGRACIAAAEAWRAKYVLSQCYDDLLGAAREALGEKVTRVEMGRRAA